MKPVLISIILCMVFAWQANAQINVAQMERPYALVVHGGAGNLSKGNLSEALEAQYKAGLQRALDSGEAILAKGGSALDAVQKAIMILEDDSLFNAGRGAVFTDEGKNELDASIMDGSNLDAGAVAGITTIKNPIKAARMVMEKSEHVMLAGKGAEQFAEKNGCKVVEPSYFSTEKNKRALEQAKENRGKKSMNSMPGSRDEKYGTVGAVALDRKGNLAAGTSTGGMTGKKYGRIGDSPVIGAGTYADNVSCAVSCTGWGEYFIRLAFAKAISDRVELQNITLEEATRTMIHDKLQNMGATGGVIAVDKYGNIAIDFNTNGMHRGWVKSNGEHGVEIYKN